MSSPPSESERRQRVDLDEQTLYWVIRNAVEDAILGVLGTLLLLAIAGFFAWLGWLFLLGGSRSELAFGVLFFGFGLYLGGATLGLIPTVRQWLDARREP